MCVLISDAFRYELGEELQNLIRQEECFEAEREQALSMLSSFTQLGMAALFPSQALADNGRGAALLNGRSATGPDNRARILASRAVGGGRQGQALHGDIVKIERG